MFLCSFKPATAKAIFRLALVFCFEGKQKHVNGCLQCERSSNQPTSVSSLFLFQASTISASLFCIVSPSGAVLNKKNTH